MIKHFNNILVAIDFKETEQAEIDHAMHLAKIHGAKLTYMSVLPELPPDAHLEISAMSPEERLELQLEKRREKLEGIAACVRESGIDAECIVVAGQPSSEVIIRQVLRDDHDLLMIAERSTSPSIKSRLMGSTATQLIRKCPCPVWAVHPDRPGDYDRVMATIDVGKHEDINNKALNENIVAAAIAIAQADNSELSMVSVPPSEEAKPEHLETIKSCLMENEVEIDEDKIYLEVGDVPSVITKATTDYNIDLLVMGMLSRSRIKGFFIGNTVEKVLENVECSLLTIKPDEFVSPVTLDD